MKTLLDIAKEYYESGLNVLPASKRQKRPLCKWREFTTERPDFARVFSDSIEFDAVAVVCGQTSGGLEVIDFDQKGALFKAFKDKVGDALEGCAVESTQSGGVHVAYRTTACGRNVKLANTSAGCAIETRGEGGICIISPTNGYEIKSGTWTSLPTLDKEQRNKLINAAISLDETKPKEPAPVVLRTNPTTFTRGDDRESVADYLRRSDDWRGALIRSGWSFIRANDAFEFWARPGQTIAGKVGGCYSKEEGYFHVFSSNGAPLEVDKTYSPLQLIAALEHDGDISAASREYARRVDRASDRIIEVINADESDFNATSPETIRTDATTDSEQERETQTSPTLPEFPQELLECGGMMGALQDLRNQYAIRRQPEGAFLGALADMSFLTGRSFSVNFSGNMITPNLYALFLAPSGMGKEIIRRVGAEVARIYRPNESIPESFASVQALQNMLCRLRKIYWLHDEFGRDLAVMNGERSNSNVTSVITESLKVFSNGNNRNYLPRVVAQDAKESNSVAGIDRPSLTIFATGNPKEFFDATSDTLLKNGYVARFTVIYGRTYSEKTSETYEDATKTRPFEVPRNVQRIIRQWADVESSTGDGPIVAGFTRDAYNVFKAFDDELEQKIRDGSTSGKLGVEHLARYSEKIWKYALLFECSKVGADPGMEIGAESMELAAKLARYESGVFEFYKNRMGGNDLSRFSEEVMEWARTQPGGFFSKSQFTRRFQRRGSTREREEVLSTLLDAEYLTDVWLDTGGRRKKGFSLNE
ncbi:MAG: DUF3987 domain-containing protein [Thermoguttaceae bacterium]